MNMTLHISYAVIIVTLIVSQILRRRHDVQNRLFLMVLILMALGCGAHLLFVLVNRNGTAGLRTVIDTAAFLFECTIFPIFFAFLLHDADAQFPMEKGYRKAVINSAAVSVIFFLIYAANAAAGNQVRMISFFNISIKLNHLFLLPCRIVQYALLATFALTHKDTGMAKREYVLLLCLIMTSAAFVDMIINRFDISHLAATCTALLIYLNFQQEAEKRKESMELELINTRLSLILGKIRPDFVFATLGEIEKLCLKDPEEAQFAINLLSDYLRGNIDRIDTNDVIPFADELEHIQNYIGLVQLCGNDVILRCDLSFTAFRVPVRSVLPLVEQFVNDMKCEHRAFETITIVSRKEDEAAIVEVYGPASTLHHDMSMAREQYKTISSRLCQFKGSTLILYCNLDQQLHAVLRFPPEKSREELS